MHLRDGNPVLAVIKATGVNQDGQTQGITVPNGEAQKKLLLQSLRRAGVEADAIQYAEAHGTGTAVGDPIEINGLGAVLGSRDRAQPRCGNWLSQKQHWPYGSYGRNGRFD